MGDLGPRKEIISSVYEIAPDVLEQLCQLIEQRGLRIPVGQIVGYERERLAALVSNGAQTITSGAQADLTFATTLYDSQKVFDGTSTFTLPYNGIYLATGYTTWAANTAGTRYSALTQNAVVRAQDWRTAGAAGSQTSDATLAAIILGVKGDAIRKAVFQDSGGNLNTGSSTFSIAFLNAY